MEQVIHPPGTFCWPELATTDADAATRFYTGLLPWKSSVVDMGPVPYTMFQIGDAPAGGMMQMTAEWGGISPHWMVYFAVDDCGGRAEKAKNLGGTVKVPPTDIPAVGRFSVLQDPQGAVFSIIQLNQPG
jgi:predicted enzyme related to lactoylglutathione lyase